jgi:hypothetical protein
MVFNGVKEGFAVSDLFLASWFLPLDSISTHGYLWVSFQRTSPVLSLRAIARQSLRQVVNWHIFAMSLPYFRQWLLRTSQWHFKNTWVFMGIIFNFWWSDWWIYWIVFFSSPSIIQKSINQSLNLPIQHPFQPPRFLLFLTHGLAI